MLEKTFFVVTIMTLVILVTIDFVQAHKVCPAPRSESEVVAEQPAPELELEPSPEPTPVLIDRAPAPTALIESLNRLIEAGGIARSSPIVLEQDFPLTLSRPGGLLPLVVTHPGITPIVSPTPAPASPVLPVTAPLLSPKPYVAPVYPDPWDDDEPTLPAPKKLTPPSAN